MKVSNTETIVGETITESLGIVRGNTIRARNVGRDIMAFAKNIVGGEVHEYTKLMAEAREQAYDRMLEDAKSKGADGIVNVRFTTSTITQGAAELLAYGTAVKLAKK
ncbi:MAG: YbjQ family protein [bacterium]